MRRDERPREECSACRCALAVSRVSSNMQILALYVGYDVGYDTSEYGLTYARLGEEAGAIKNGKQ